MFRFTKYAYMEVRVSEASSKGLADDKILLSLVVPACCYCERPPTLLSSVIKRDQHHALPAAVVCPSRLTSSQFVYKHCFQFSGYEHARSLLSRSAEHTRS